MKTTLYLLVTLLFAGIGVSAQSTNMNEGYINFDIDVQAIDTSRNAQQSAAMMRNSSMEIFFAKDLSRVDFTLGKISQTSVRINRKTNKGVSLSNTVMGKCILKPLFIDVKANGNPGRLGFTIPSPIPSILIFFVIQ